MKKNKMIEPNMVEPHMVNCTMIEPNMIEPNMIEPNMITANLKHVTHKPANLKVDAFSTPGVVLHDRDKQGKFIHGHKAIPPRNKKGRFYKVI